MKPDDRRFAKDVATHLDRRRMRRKLLVYAAIVAAIVVAVTYLTCGRGWGLGGKGSGAGGGSSKPVLTEPGPKRCALRVTASGILLGGEKVSRAEAVAACKAATGADVIVTGDARQGDWDELRAALEQAGVAIFRREPAP